MTSNSKLIILSFLICCSLFGTGNIVMAVCLDGTIDGVEQCDPPDFGVHDCISQGFDGGILGCDAFCNFDTSGCCTRNNPIVTITPVSISGLASQAQTYSLSVKNDDTAASCANRTFALSLSGLTPCVPGWSDDLDINTGPLAGQATYTKNVVISSCASSAVGTHTFTITATQGGDSGNDSADYVIVAPSVEICNVVGDEDGDGAFDCADPDCLGKAPCCGDGIQQFYESCDTSGDMGCAIGEICAGCNNCISSSIAGECPTGYDDCDCNGTCETDVLSDPFNCGKCGNICGSKSCINGSCLPVLGGLVPCGRMSDDPATSWGEQEECKLCHLVILADSITEYLLEIVGIITVLSLVIGGMFYIVSSGNSNLVTVAKTTFRKSLYGFVAVFIAWVATNTTMVLFGFDDPLGDGSWHKFDCGLMSGPITNYYCGDGFVTAPNDNGVMEVCDPTELKNDFITRKTASPGNCVNNDLDCPPDCFTTIDNDCVNVTEGAAWVKTLYSCNLASCDFGCATDVTAPGFSEIGEGCYQPNLAGGGLGVPCQKGRYVCDFNTDTVVCQNTYNDSIYRLAGHYCNDIYDECCVDGGAALPGMTFDIVRLPTTNITSCVDWDCYWPGYQDGVCTCPAGYSCDDICKDNGGKVCIGVGLMDVSAYHCISLKDNFGSAPCSGDYQCNNSANLLTNDCRAEFYTTIWTCDECSDVSPIDGVDEAYDFSVGETACYCK